MPLDRILTHTENSVPPAFAWRIPGLKSETWGTHQLIQEVLTSRAQKGAHTPAYAKGRNITGTNIKRSITEAATG